MNKNDLIHYVAQELPTSRLKSALLVNTVLDGIKNGLKEEESVTITGFGTFEVRTSKARLGRDPNTGEPIQIPGSRRVGFRVGRGLRQELESVDSKELS